MKWNTLNISCWLAFVLAGKERGVQDAVQLLARRPHLLICWQKHRRWRRLMYIMADVGGRAFFSA